LKRCPTSHAIVRIQVRCFTHVLTFDSALAHLIYRVFPLGTGMAAALIAHNARLPLLAVRHLFTEEISGIADLNWLCRPKVRILFFEALFVLELKVNYLEFLLLGAASTGIGLRCYFLMKREDALLAAEQSSSGRRRSAREKRAQEATLARRLFRYHSGLTHA
jgi:hypothetical protein